MPIKSGPHRPGDAIGCGGLLGNLHEMQPVPRVGFDLEAYPRHRRHAHLIGGLLGDAMPCGMRTSWGDHAMRDGSQASAARAQVGVAVGTR